MQVVGRDVLMLLLFKLPFQLSSQNCWINSQLLLRKNHKLPLFTIFKHFRLPTVGKLTRSRLASRSYPLMVIQSTDDLLSSLLLLQNVYYVRVSDTERSHHGFSSQLPWESSGLELSPLYFLLLPAQPIKSDRLNYSFENPESTPDRHYAFLPKEHVQPLGSCICQCRSFLHVVFELGLTIDNYSQFCCHVRKCHLPLP